MPKKRESLIEEQRKSEAVARAIFFPNDEKTQRRLNNELIDAVSIDDLVAVRRLDRQGANIQADDNFPFCSATANSQIEMMRYLLGRGADYTQINDAHFLNDKWSQDKLKKLFSLDLMLNHREAALHFWALLPDQKKTDDLCHHYKTNSFLGLQTVTKKRLPRSKL